MILTDDELGLITVQHGIFGSVDFDHSDAISALRDVERAVLAKLIEEADAEAASATPGSAAMWIAKIRADWLRSKAGADER